MPRPRKCRRVCGLPVNRGFQPMEGQNSDKAIVLTVDEYETIRLIDKEDFSQEECGRFMQIARTTVQQIYTTARKKLAEALVDGLPLRIEGGDYQLCDGKEEACRCGGCRRRQMQLEALQTTPNKEEKTMKVAIPLDENKQDVCVAFARAPYFLFAENGTEEVVENPAAQAEGGAGLQAAQFLVDHQVGALITVRCGENAAEVFQAAEIKIYKAEGKTARENLEAFGREELAPLTHFHAGYHGIR